MAQECPRPCLGGARAHQTPIETHLIAGSDARAQLRHTPVDGEAAGTDPGLRLAP